MHPNSFPTNLWQRRFWEHAIRDQDDFDRHLDYIHYNPVKHGWVAKASDLPIGHEGRIQVSIVLCGWGIIPKTGRRPWRWMIWIGGEGIKRRVVTRVLLTPYSIASYGLGF